MVLPCPIKLKQTGNNKRSSKECFKFGAMRFQYKMHIVNSNFIRRYDIVNVIHLVLQNFPIKRNDISTRN